MYEYKNERITEKIAKNVRHYLKLNNMTPFELANKVNLKENDINRILNAEVFIPAYDLRKIAKVFNINFEDLWEEKDKNV